MEDGDECQGHSINEDLRMMGERGDDEEDLGADAEALFGVSAEQPIDLADGEEDHDANGDDPDTQTTAKKNKPCTSDVWDDFEKIFKIINGKRKRYQAKCIHCGTIYSGLSTGGTGHLLRHRDRCSVRKEKNRMSQSLINFTSDGNLHHWEYSPEVAHTQLVRLIARLDLPICFGESDAFLEYIKIAHNPRFSTVSRQTTTRDIVRYYDDRRAKLIESLTSGVTSVAITSDIWSGSAKEDYLSVVAHYINSDWQLEKRIIGFRLIDVSHNGQNIADRVTSVLEEYALTVKVFAVTLDNASSNTNAIEKMAPQLSSYVGDLFLHQRCACHIVNLIVKSALGEIKGYLESFRTAISFINSSNQRIAAFKRYCIAVNVRPRKFGLDMDVRWNSTYLMLKHLVPYKATFSVFIQTNYPRKEGEAMLLTEDHWYVAEKILAFLELFYDATVSLSGIYYPTSPLMMHHLILIAKHLKNYENDRLLRTVVVPMKDYYLKYWRDIPLLYSVAFILDPRAKMKGFNNVLRLLSNLTGTDYSAYFTEVRAQLSTVFNKYDHKFGAVRLQRPSQQQSVGKKKAAWDDIFSDLGNDAPDLVSGSGISFSTHTPPSLNRRTSASALLQAASTTPVGVGGMSELSSYLDSDTITHHDDNFNILHWWHEHKLIYPVLSILARDVFTVPVSTISSESAFSTTGRIIEERQRRLTPEMVEMLTCIKDWEEGEARLQHMVEDKDLLASFENLYLDE